MENNQIIEKIIGCAIEVHKRPGLGYTEIREDTEIHRVYSTLKSHRQ